MTGITDTIGTVYISRDRRAGGRGGPALVRRYGFLLPPLSDSVSLFFVLCVPRLFDSQPRSLRTTLFRALHPSKHTKTLEFHPIQIHFTMRSTALLALVSVPMVLASSHGQDARRHHEVAKRAGAEVNLHKRFDGVRLTFYAAGLSVAFNRLKMTLC